MLMGTRSTDFTHIAASCRQAYNGIRRPSVVLESCFNMNQGEIVEYIRFFYQDDRVDYRLTDEDLREIFYLLTDVYPEEVHEDPDLIQILSNLSEQIESKASFTRIHSLMKGMLDADNNNIRAMQMRSILTRLIPRDAYWVILRMQRKANPFKRRDVIMALANVFNIPSVRLTHASSFMDLPTIAKHLIEGKDIATTPVIGDKMLMPLPVRWTEAGLPFTETYLEVIRGERLTLHTEELDKNTSFTMVLDPNGQEVTKEAVKDVSQFLPNGIYTIEYVPKDDFPITVVDVLLCDSVQDSPFSQRREWLEEILPDMFLKPMVHVRNPSEMKRKCPKNGITFLHNGDAIVDYTNPRSSIVRYTTKATGDVFRVIGGVWQHQDGRGLVLSGWQVAARDGVDGYYEVGVIQAEPDLEKQLRDRVQKAKALEGEMALMVGPTFAQVDVHYADYDDRGIIIQGVITDIISNAGISDVVPVEEVEWLVGDDGER